MAITKIHAIRSTVQKSVDYICNPHKTDNRILIDHHGCGIETAALDFYMDNTKALQKENAIPAFHLIQSFAPGEVTFEEAHQIGQEFASELLGSSRAYVIATHIDREHVHNHIIFCSTDYLKNQRYYSNRASYRNLRNISDRLCKEHGLSVIKPGVEKGKKYNEWEAEKKNNSFKLNLKKDIFDCIRFAEDYKDFLKRMRDKNYEIKGFELGEDAPKYISFKPQGYGNFIRGSHRTLGKGYTKEEIIERIEKHLQSRADWIKKQKNLPLNEKNLIDTSSDKFTANPGLSNWANLTNLKIAASTYASVGSSIELEEKINLLKEQCASNRSEIVSIDKEKRILSEQIRYMQIYLDTKAYKDAYEHSKNPEEYLMQFESKLTLFDGAAVILASHGLVPSNECYSRLRDELSDLEERRSEIKNENESIQKELKELERHQDTLNRFFNKDNPKKETNEKNKDAQKQRGD